LTLPLQLQPFLATQIAFHEQLRFPHRHRRIVDARRCRSRDGAQVSDGGCVIVQQQSHRHRVDFVVLAAGRTSEQGRELANTLRGHGAQMQRHRITLTAERGGAFAREDAIEFEQSLCEVVCGAHCENSRTGFHQKPL